MIEYFGPQIALAVSRIDYTVKELHAGENKWELDPADGRYVFRGYIADFIVEKHVIDLLREVWHLGDGAREFINAKWKAGTLNTDVDTDNGKGPGKNIVIEKIKSCRWIQLCGDLANLTKHYKLTRATKTGNAPPQLGSTAFIGTTSGKIDFMRDEVGERTIKFDKPVPMRPTMVVLDEKGERIGDAVEIAVNACNSWLHLLAKVGCEFERTGGMSANADS